MTAGAVAGRAELVASARTHLVESGTVLDPFPAFLLRRGLKTLTLRMERQSRNALAVARFLEAHPKVARVLYAGLESYPQHELAHRQLDDFGGMLAVEVEGGREAGERFDGRARAAARRATSLGGVDTVVHHPASTSHRQYSAPSSSRRRGSRRASSASP